MNKPRDPDSQPAHSPRGQETSAEDLTARNVQTVVELEAAERNNRTLSDRLADAVAGFCGSMVFFWVHVAWFGGWIAMNSLPGFPHFDPFPFTFLTLVVSLEAIFLSTFIMISQTQETRLSDRRNHLDLQINLLTEQENTRMLNLLTAIAKELGVPEGSDPEVEMLAQATKPEILVRQIDRAMEGKALSDKKTPPAKSTNAD